MPAEDFPVVPPGRPPVDEGWHALAEEAAQWPGEHQGLQALRQHHVNRLLGEHGLGHLATSKEDKAGARFLHQYGVLDQREVNEVVGYLRKNGVAIPDKAAERTAAYLDFMADTKVVNDGMLTGDEHSIARQIDARVIKPEDVPESYFALQQRIAREQGYGHIEITPDMRRQLIEAAQADQRGSLHKWVEYLGGEDGSYPDWFKRYTWDSVVKLGSYNKEKRRFSKREVDTVAPYPELDREALAYAYDTIKKFHVLGESVDDAQLKQLLKEGSFGRLYAHAILEVTPNSPESRQEVRGSWTQFHQTNDPRTARRLSGSLQGHGTGWCTAGESTAAAQLGVGDFYVYYTRDEDGKDTVPRVAIRMQNGEVAEVRGILPSQELEPAMADTTAERLKNLPGGEEYIRKADDMKRLTAIDKKITTTREADLTSEELRLLYELDHEIKGFGYDVDPRIAEIRGQRGNRDKPELARLLPETIREQVQAAYMAYRTVADKLQGTKRGIFARTHEFTASPQELEALVATKDKEWQANGVYDYLVEQLIENGTRFNLVATPNIEASEAQIVALAEDFGKGQPYPTYVYDDLYRKGRYTARDWSGNEGSAPIRLSLIPSRTDSEISNKHVSEQVRLLRARQASRPELRARIPSVLDAVTYWYSLRAGGDTLDDGSAFEKTYIRHFDLEPQRLGGWLSVPYSCVNSHGEPRLFTRTRRTATMLVSRWGKTFSFFLSSFLSLFLSRSVCYNRV